MKQFAVLVLIVGMLCNCTLAVAEGPIPFHELARSASMRPSLPLLQDGQGSATAAQPQKPASRPMTRGGKIMTGFGIGLLGLGVLFIAAGATTSSDDFLGSEFKTASFFTGGIFAAGGTTLIVFGTHRRKANEKVAVSTRAPEDD
jgi:hypothetical protein